MNTTAISGGQVFIAGIKILIWATPFMFADLNWLLMTL